MTLLESVDQLGVKLISAAQSKILKKGIGIGAALRIKISYEMKELGVLSSLRIEER